MDEMIADPGERMIAYTTDIVAAHVANNAIPVAEVPTLIRTVHAALVGLGGRSAALPEREPAVPVRASVKPDHIVCLEDGKKLKMLKRYLSARFGMTPEQYRKRWKLPPDYPMVAPAYAEQRRSLAKQIGLGTRTRSR